MSRSKQTKNRREVEKYIDERLSGKQPAGKNELLALQRHLDDLEHAVDRGFVFSWSHADVALDFFPLLKHPRGAAAGTAFTLEPAQKTALSILFGWRRIDSGLRRFREAYISMARGNGKSPLAAGIALMLFAADAPFTPGAEVVCVATTRAQARKYVWDQARGFIKSVPGLADRIALKKDTIEYPCGNTVGTFDPLGSDSNNLDGGNYLAAVVDELHAMREQHRELIEKINGGLGKRDQDLKVTITTAGSDRSVLWLEEYDYACKVLNGVVSDDLYFSYIWEADRDDDPLDRDEWAKANPLLKFLSLDKFEQAARKAVVSPAKKNEFTRYKINRKTSSKDKAFPPELWKQGNAALSNLDGCTCYGGLDLGWRDDLAAFVLVFPLEDDDGQTFYEVKCWAWLPEETKRDITREPFRTLLADGSIITTDGNTTDHRAILQTIAECSERYDLQTVAADPNNARAVLTELVSTHGVETFDFRQTCRNYNEPVMRWLDALDEGRVRHAGDRLLAWSADNVVLRTDAAGYVMPDKNASAEKIDLPVALLMAFSECLFAEQQEPETPVRIRAL